MAGVQSMAITEEKTHGFKRTHTPLKFNIRPIITKPTIISQIWFMPRDNNFFHKSVVWWYDDMKLVISCHTQDGYIIQFILSRHKHYMCKTTRFITACHWTCTHFSHFNFKERLCVSIHWQKRNDVLYYLLFADGKWDFPKAHAWLYNNRNLLWWSAQRVALREINVDIHWFQL